MNRITINIRPFPCVRVNGKKGRFAPKAIEYHDKCNYLRLVVWSKKNLIMNALLSWEYKINFIFKMPDNFSVKKKALMNWKPYISTPDSDNCYKAFTDTIFYQSKINDSQIHTINWVRKLRGVQNKIEFLY